MCILHESGICRVCHRPHVCASSDPVCHVTHVLYVSDSYTGRQLRVPVSANGQRARSRTQVVGGIERRREKRIQLYGTGSLLSICLRWRIHIAGALRARATPVPRKPLIYSK